MISSRINTENIPGNKLSYPKLMKHHINKVIILATRPTNGGIAGVVVFGPNMGEYAVKWNRDNFYDYEGEICLSNLKSS